MLLLLILLVLDTIFCRKLSPFCCLFLLHFSREPKLPWDTCSCYLTHHQHKSETLGTIELKIWTDMNSKTYFIVTFLANQKNWNQDIICHISQNTRIHESRIIFLAQKSYSKPHSAFLYCYGSLAIKSLAANGLTLEKWNYSRDSLIKICMFCINGKLENRSIFCR